MKQYAALLILLMFFAVNISPAFGDCGACAKESKKAEDSNSECSKRGELSKAELNEKMEKVFKKADTDSNGTISKEEFLAIHDTMDGHCLCSDCTEKAK